jgi:phage terminase large subunit
VDFPNGSQVRLYGADNPDALRGIYLDGVVPDEFGLMQGKVWSEVLRPALTDRKGWAVFIGTPNGKNAFWELRDFAAADPAWYLAEYKASETEILPADELDLARSTMSADAYAQEFECSFEASVRGAVFAKEMQFLREFKRIGKVNWEPSLPVNTAWDLGISDSTAIWFVQLASNEARVIDYYEASGEALGPLRQRAQVQALHLGQAHRAARRPGAGAGDGQESARDPAKPGHTGDGESQPGTT